MFSWGTSCLNGPQIFFCFCREAFVRYILSKGGLFFQGSRIVKGRRSTVVCGAIVSGRRSSWFFRQRVFNGLQDTFQLMLILANGIFRLFVNIHVRKARFRRVGGNVVHSCPFKFMGGESFTFRACNCNGRRGS